MERRLQLVEEQLCTQANASLYDNGSIRSSGSDGSDNLTIRGNAEPSSMGLAATAVDETSRYSLPQREFEELLNNSWVYRRNKSRDENMSFRSSVLRLSAWSVLSEMSLANISIIAVMALPVQIQELANGHWYTFGASQEHRGQSESATIPISGVTAHGVDTRSLGEVETVQVSFQGHDAPPSKTEVSTRPAFESGQSRQTLAAEEELQPLPSLPRSDTPPPETGLSLMRGYGGRDPPLARSISSEISSRVGLSRDSGHPPAMSLSNGPNLATMTSGNLFDANQDPVQKILDYDKSRYGDLWKKLDSLAREDNPRSGPIHTDEGTLSILESKTQSLLLRRHMDEGTSSTLQSNSTTSPSKEDTDEDNLSIPPVPPIPESAMSTSPPKPPTSQSYSAENDDTWVSIEPEEVLHSCKGCGEVSLGHVRPSEPITDSSSNRFWKRAKHLSSVGANTLMNGHPSF